MRLYRFRFSTNVERVALALAFKGLEVESVWIDPEDRTPVREASGQDLVPVLEDEGEIVADSTRILEHLDARFPDPPLYPREAARRGEVVVFIDWFNRVWKSAPNEIEAELSRDRPDEERIGELAGEMASSLNLFEAILAGRDYLTGEFSAADCAAFPFLKYGVLHDPEDTELFHRILADNLPVGAAHPRLRAWIERVDERPRA
ncbi:MAG: glutathione S-transferase family protein [Actinobacteria bacterium]|nr:glutathione S-transferase family protein [Actinomycetota bacterium]